MFPTFTGTSRRPRNVNLSGQRNTNPWASGASGASTTVAQAQAEREKRKKERDELNASKRLQRIWRGYRGRQGFRQMCREEYDALYGQQMDHEPSHRATTALPLLLKLFDASKPDDQQRLDLFVQDLVRLGSAPSNFVLFRENSWDRLARLFVGALERCVHNPYQSFRHLNRWLTLCRNRRPATSSYAILGILMDIVRKRPVSITPMINQYYKLLSRYFEQSNVSNEQQEILSTAVTVPLVSGSEQGTLTTERGHTETVNPV